MIKAQILDLISGPLSEKRFRDRVSQTGLIRGKRYTSESVMELSQENVLNESAVIGCRGSSIPVGTAGETSKPQVRELEALSVEIRYDSDAGAVVDARSSAVSRVICIRVLRMPVSPRTDDGLYKD
jgi:hypothetical protein